MSEVVLFEEISCANGKSIGLATLNSERSLNALSHDMVKALYPQLVAWQADNNIALVFLQGAGEKAFCAGGDIVHLYNNLPVNNGDKAPAIEEFFKDEYQVDHLIHAYQKPIVIWGNGIVMGGGLGLMAGGSHRVVTENTRIAMPEISIGLYPDVGGTYFLNKMPNNCGLFLGLTGASINAADAKYTQLADHFVNNDKKGEVIDKLVTVKWGDTVALNHEKLSAVLVECEQASITSMALSNVQQHQELIDTVTAHETLTAIVEHIAAIEVEDKWFNRAQKSLAHGSALSAQLTYRQIQTGKNLSLADCFRLELTISTKCGEYGEFKEGVRALLIEKDNKPNWAFADVASVDQDVIDWFFTSNWSESEHPLAGLG
ncbi:enoyl-CoA hydratase/isomerase family protein [Thalassotalea sp. ND16A]|uniref:enoyl-CoA hydratase/isomerase family protein n=1 Tax=Thalassotalea sp. ND16A TaxID=1535422 RepID=UPI00051A4D0E|nr:enoyl-CoA hydratase/isomerase family protein [Thalassotalea sp. ND16A]KGJ93623.1 3-hydroxyisobutyryl-CoA hydrolase [Thalassotalea sp. ND16A]